MSDIHKCGFCGLLSGLLRRVMCVGNRRGSNESYYRELGDQDMLRVDRQTCASSDSGLSEEPVNLENEEDRQTFQEALKEIIAEDSNENMKEPARNQLAMFHSFRRKERKRVMKEELTNIIDDCYPMQVQLILSKCTTWEFDTHDLDRATGGRCLPILGMHLFTGYGLFEFFKLLPERCWKLFQTIEKNYHDDNLYHNSVHAADVTQAIHCFLQQPQLMKYMNRLEIMVALLAAITHDLDHPGVNHSFLVATNHPLAIMFKDKSIGMNDRTPLPRRGRRGRKLHEMLLELAATKAEFTELESSPVKPKAGSSSSWKKAPKKVEEPPQCESILEHHHWRVAYSCILQSGIFDHMQERLPEIQHMLKSLILATDITKQNEYLSAFKDLQAHGSLDMTRADHRHMVLQMALKTADISNPGRPWAISKKWSYKVCSEFYAQGDEELKLNLKISNLCDREKDTISKIQTGFFRYVVTPLFTEWHHYLNSNLSRRLLTNLVHNEAEWTREGRRSEQNSRTVTQSDAFFISDADMVENELETSTNISGSSEMLIPDMGSGGFGSETRVPRRGSYSPVSQSSVKDAIRRYSAPLHAYGEPRSRSRIKTSIPEYRLREELLGVPTSATIKSDQSHYMSMLEIAMVVASDKSRNRDDDGVSCESPAKTVEDVEVAKKLIDFSSPRRVMTYTVQADSDEEDINVEVSASPSRNGFIKYSSIIIEESSISSASQLTPIGSSCQFLLPSQSTNTTSAPSSESRLDRHLEEDIMPEAKLVTSSCEVMLFPPEKSVDDVKDVLFPHLSISGFYHQRRGSAPAPISVSDLQRFTSNFPLHLTRKKHSASCQEWVAASEEKQAGEKARRGSLPAEVMTGISA